MALINRTNKIPKQKIPKEVSELVGGVSGEEVVLFLQKDPQFFTATNMALSMALTCLARYGGPIKVSDLVKISSLGIFGLWEAKRKFGQLCDQGYFTRQHVGLEEFLFPEKEFWEFIKTKRIEKRSGII